MDDIVNLIYEALSNPSYKGKLCLIFSFKYHIRTDIKFMNLNCYTSSRRNGYFNINWSELLCLEQLNSINCVCAN